MHERMPGPGPRGRVPPRAAADVRDQRRRGGQKPQDDLGRPGELEQPPASAQPVAFLAPLVVRMELSLVRIVHDASR
jgi:hypothetical protein